MPYRFNPRTGDFDFYEKLQGVEIRSEPVIDAYYVTNVYVENGKLKVEYDDVPMATTGGPIALKSDPPSGACQVKNLYVDPETGKLIVKYES